MENSHFKPFCCWLFCTVIDNFGDIGVSWRLAQSIKRQLNWEVHLWLDDFSALTTIVPDALAQNDIILHYWQENQFAQDVQTAPLPNLVIETFACSLPQSVLDIIKKNQSLWLNWEYLSAENWAVKTHLMPSLQANGSRKYFWQMGFLPQTGGLLHEPDYLEKQYLFLAQQTFRQPETHIFAFAYASKVWEKWCETWAKLNRPIVLHAAGQPLLSSLPQNSSGSLKIMVQDFVPQTHFDELLWASDINIVRGEDSFIRAQLAAKPFFWHIYPQDEMAHLDKLNAFWQIAWQDQSALCTAYHALSDELNGASILSDTNRAIYWTMLLDNLSIWQNVMHVWRNQLLSQSNAVSRLNDWVMQQQNS
ncbi:MAG: elongation factor P maturation arginine rhamnosyltransferase EarP [Kingella sp. (in: b-proteobacteria)]